MGFAERPEPASDPASHNHAIIGCTHILNISGFSLTAGAREMFYTIIDTFNMANP
jgi:hypothetical protein